MQKIPRLDQEEGKPRMDAVDVAKGIGIIAVVVGHILPIPSVVAVIYCFHMPLFFFLSGFLHGELKRHSIAQYVRSRLVPYAAFGLFVIALTLFLRYLKRGAIEPDIVALAFRSFFEGKPVRGTDLWFYPCLLIVELLGLVLLKVRGLPVRLGFGGILATIGFLLSPWSLSIPWNIDIALVALPFWLAGAFAREKEFLRWAGSSIQWRLTIPIAVAILYYKCFVLRSGVDMRTAAYGGAFLFYAAAAGGIAVTLLVSKALVRNKALTLIGRASVAIYPTNGIIVLIVEILFGQTGMLVQLSEPSRISLHLICAIAGGIAFYAITLRNAPLRFLTTGRYKRAIA
jgi:acyltransferase